MPPTAPQPRREHAAWVHDDWMYIFGELMSTYFNSSCTCNGLQCRSTSCAVRRAMPASALHPAHTPPHPCTALPGGTSNSIQMEGRTNHPNFAMTAFTFSVMWRLHLRELR